ncbi:GspH/FimT family pseudopilin [Aeromonas media]|uniref:GspH/FimT family pseudopilin n=1 Tax=Aeromonas media TaxID=651 RepID=UPI00148B0CCF|nr:GspH/FimT family protein [Aeromonas media]QJT25296.1 prepilin-type N-terminal cleavage/methylation domain-containing protein [Aeromonas media]
MEMRIRPESGFTLIELILALALVAILVAVALPSYRSLRQEQMVRAATQALYTDMMLLKSEAIKRGGPLTLKLFNAGQSNWCYRIAIDATCSSCADHCSSIEGRKGADANEFGGVVIDASNQYKSGSTASITFTPRRGTFLGGNLIVSNDASTTNRVVIATYGRISTCVEGDTC